MKQTKNEKGVTLIALVITIIVMLILVGVTINLVVKGNLFNYARDAKEQTAQKISDERGLADVDLEQYVKGTTEEDTVICYVDNIDDPEIVFVPNYDIENQIAMLYFLNVSELPGIYFQEIDLSNPFSEDVAISGAIDNDDLTLLELISSASDKSFFPCGGSGILAYLDGKYYISTLGFLIPTTKFDLSVVAEAQMFEGL